MFSIPGTPVRIVEERESKPSTPQTPVRYASLDGIQSRTGTPSTSETLAHMRAVMGGGSRPTTPKRGTPDRFIPSLASPLAFYMGAPTSELSPGERLLRRHVPDDDRRDVVSVADPLSVQSTPPAVPAVHIPAGLAPLPAPVPRQRGREINGNILSNKRSPEREQLEHKMRLSAALGVDRARRVLNFTGSRDDMDSVKRTEVPGVVKPADKIWESVMGSPVGNSPPRPTKGHSRSVSTTPFRVLDAPGLRDDYYCSLIAYSPLTHSLAVGLHSDVYSWKEDDGARPFEQWSRAHVTSLAFSSADGKNNILAIGRIDGNLALWNPHEVLPRISEAHNASIACLAWKPIVSPPFTRSRIAENLGTRYTEDLLVGDEIGNVYLYAISWGVYNPNTRRNATMVLVRRILAHTQQICGLAWRHDGHQFATGGNDNTAFLFDTVDVDGRHNEQGTREHPPTVGMEGGHMHRWQHRAAVKAIAFCPWQKTLLATGGGSNDRCIHFFHTGSGAALSTINVSAQVTSLLWSNSHREIAATLGYANPDHPIRIVVYNWPQCEQVLQIAWQEDMRALYAVAYPGGPQTSEGGLPVAGEADEEDDDDDIRLLREVGARPSRRTRRKRTEGCIVVAASDETVRFHEVWNENKREVLQNRGVLGGSEILEELEGIEGRGAGLIR